MQAINMKTYLVVQATLLSLVCSTALARTIYVDDDGPAEYSRIQDAVDAASNGDTIIVKNGTYIGEGNRDIDFKGKTITIRSESGPDNCIISCQGTEAEPHRGFHFHSGESANSVVDGFTICNGYGPVETTVLRTASSGGAIFCRNSDPTIVNCVITQNSARDVGGIYC